MSDFSENIELEEMLENLQNILNSSNITKTNFRDNITSSIMKQAEECLARRYANLKMKLILIEIKK